MLALKHGISRLLAHIFFTSIEIFRILHVVSQRSKSFRQSNSCNYSFVGVSCRLFSFTRASSHFITILIPTITIVMGCDDSGKPMESISPQSQINTRLLRPEYHHVCSKQGQGNSSCVNLMLLQLRFPEASSCGSTSIITRWISSFSSTALQSVAVGPFCFCLSKSLKFPLAYPMNFFPSIDSLVLSGTAENILYKNNMTSSLILCFSALRRLDPRSPSYSLHPPLRNALGICFCLLELMSIPLDIALPTVYDSFHYAGCSFPPRSLPSTFQYTFVGFAKLPEKLLH